MLKFQMKKSSVFDLSYANFNAFSFQSVTDQQEVSETAFHLHQMRNNSLKSVKLY